MVVLVSVLTARRSDCCLRQQTEDHCSPRGNAAAGRRHLQTQSTVQPSHGQHLREAELDEALHR